MFPVVRGNFSKSIQTDTTNHCKENKKQQQQKRSLQHHALSGIHCDFFSLTLFFLFVFFYILILSQKDKLVLLTLKKRSIMHKCSFFLFVLNLLFFFALALLSLCMIYILRRCTWMCTFYPVRRELSFRLHFFRRCFVHMLHKWNRFIWSDFAHK